MRVTSRLAARPFAVGSPAMLAALNLVALGGGVVAAPSAQAQTTACTGTYIFCDDFNTGVLDTSKWTKRSGTIGPVGKVAPGNISLGTTTDNDGGTIGVVDVKMFGDNHTAAPRQGGILVTNAKFGAGRYEVRMKNLPDRNGCSCFWNYYDSEDEANPPATRTYTEIDIEMPANYGSQQPPTWANWRYKVGLNTWSNSPADADATYLKATATVNPFDAKFHVFRFDWSTSGSTRQIVWYMDGVELKRTTEHVSNVSAPIWVGAWPAPWTGMLWNFDTKHMYIDWVKITAL